MKTIPENKKFKTGGWWMSLHGVPILMTGERVLFLPGAPCDRIAGGNSDDNTGRSTDSSTHASADGSTNGNTGGSPTLILSDTHFGKAETFQEHGIPVPTDHTDRDLDLLRQLVHIHGTRRIIILGDLFHSTRNSSWDRVLSGFQSMKNTDLILVMGNHDIIRRDDYESIGFTCVSGMPCGPFYLQHHPPDHMEINDQASTASRTQNNEASAVPLAQNEDKPEIPQRQPDSNTEPGVSSPFVICGHLHPSFRIKGPARQRITLPCFWLRPGCLVLPAFGSFTGSHPVTTRPGDLVLLATGDSVIPHSHEPDV